MDNFLRYFYQDASRIFGAFIDIFKAIGNFFNFLFNFPMRMEIIRQNSENFEQSDWIFLLIVNILFLLLIGVIIFFLIKYRKKLFPFYASAKKVQSMEKEVDKLRKDLMRANYEKDKLLAMQYGGAGVGTQEEISSEEVESSKDEYVPLGKRNTFDGPLIDPSESRFFRLTTIDNYFKKEYVKPTYDNNVTLEEFCERFRLFAASKLHLYYDLSMIRYFIASLGAARIVILQGISGTGKTSLPYAFGKFVQNDSAVISVQPAWRERTELYGYFNEFTKKYTETEFLATIYRANYIRDPQLLILDEMNIARVEYYFAEMLSILEMPLESEWKIDAVTSMWDNDPCLIKDGKIQITNNNWFIGTINNDDSTFAVADKVYDRAIPIDLDSRAAAFEAPPTDAIRISTDHINELFAEAKQKYQISQTMLDKIEELNEYLIKTFRLAFGNRIMKQLRDYVSCLMGCGGTEIDAVDFIVAKKVLRKFESLNLGFMGDELTKFITYLDKLFGKGKMKICREYIEILMKNS